jgi:diketogulonate reductase-like aldo/keto reductase
MAAAKLGPAKAAPATLLRKHIPSSGETVPAIGMGTWITFHVGNDTWAREQRAEVLRRFFDLGGGMVDSSPMYGSAEDVIGYCLARIPSDNRLFSATKVWTHGRQAGIDEMEASRALWGVPRFDLMQVHNLLDWESHLETLQDWKAQGRVRYIGVTTSHGRRHAELERILAHTELDFVQLTYNVLDREPERRLLPLAAERGIAVIANRPFRTGGLFRHVGARQLPGWAAEFDCTNWAQFFLKFIVSHPVVTCAIPATSRVDHMAENMGALSGRLPDRARREQMSTHVAAL